MIGNNKKAGFTPLHPETLSLEVRDEWQIKSKLLRKPHSLGWGVTGFTLVELVVAIAVFSAVITIVSSVFVSAVGSQRKNVGHQDVLDNARFVVESITRSIRQSAIVTPAVSGSSSSITINHPIKGSVVYDISNNQITENGIALSSAAVYVSRLNFTVSGNSSSDDTQPKVTVSISLRNASAQADAQSFINLQTTVVPRNLQIQL